MPDKNKNTNQKGSAINAFIDTFWAVKESSVEEMQALLQTPYQAFFDVSDIAPQAEMLGSRGVINIKGFLFKEANLATMLGLGTSITAVHTQIDELLNAGAEKIDFLFDTPGGSIDGVNGLCDRIFSLRQRVETRALISGECCSAGIWLATACGSVVATDATNMFGSLGVMFTTRKQEEDDKIVIVSSNAPLKNVDPATKEGYEVHKKTIDALEDIFISAVARNRGTTNDDVIKNYGKGGNLLAAEAHAVGMIDEIQTYNGGNMEITKELLLKDYTALLDEITGEATTELNTQITTLQGENTEFITEIAGLKQAKKDLEAKVIALTPEDDKLPESARKQIEALEKNLIESKLEGFPVEFKEAMLKMQGTVAVDTIVEVATAVNSMKETINKLGAPQGVPGGDSDTASLDAKAAKLKAKYITEGKTEYEAHKLAYREAAK